MSKKSSPRRNALVLPMTLSRKNQIFQDKRQRRINNPFNQNWHEEEDSEELTIDQKQIDNSKDED